MNVSELQLEQFQKRRAYQVQTKKENVFVTFVVPTRYKLEKVIGQGGYGVVCSATDKLTGKKVAIKQVRRVFRRSSDAKKILREIKLMKHFRHDNVLSLVDVIPPQNYNDFEDVYLVTPKMDIDLSKVIKLGTNYTEAHCKYFMFNILRGLKAIHSANVMHRDLKPGNILVDQETCNVKICDFGLARAVDPHVNDNTQLHLSQYVTTRWYRAPEVILNSQNYTKAVDMWSVGCIFAELLGKLDGNVRPLFTGKNYVDQLNKIIDVLGNPGQEEINDIVTDLEARQYMQMLPKRKKVSFKTMFRAANNQAIDLLEKLLVFDYRSRLTVEDALSHPYLAALQESISETSPLQSPFNFNYDETSLDPSALKELVFDEVVDMHPEVASKKDGDSKVLDKLSKLSIHKKHATKNVA